MRHSSALAQRQLKAYTNMHEYHHKHVDAQFDSQNVLSDVVTGAPPFVCFLSYITVVPNAVEHAFCLHKE